MNTPSELLQYILSGVTMGSIYALIALGFVTIYSVTGVINFAQGEFVMLGAMVVVALHRALIPIPLGIVATVLAVSAVGALLQWAALRPVKRSSRLTLIMITIAASISIRGAALLEWGTDPYPLPAFSPGPPLSLGGVFVVRQSIWLMGVAAILLGCLYLFFSRTMLGRAVRACAANPVAARLMGISPDRMAMLSFALSGALGATAGIVIAPITYASYDMGLMLGLKGFVAAIMGGLTNPAGAVLGGLLLGVLEMLGAGINSAYKDAVAFLILLLVLLLRPRGLFGGAELAKGGL